MKTIVVTCDKGGTAKTTTVTHFAIACANSMPDKRILLVDLDPAACLTMDIAPETPPFKGFVDELLVGLPVRPSRTKSPNMDIFPARKNLETLTRTDIFTRIRWDEGLARVLAPVAANYDYCLIDTKGGLASLHTLALRASDAYLIAMRPDARSLWGHETSKEEIEDFKVRYSFDRPARLGWVLSGVPRATRRAVDRIRQEIKTDEEGLVFIEIPLDVRFDDAVVADTDDHRSIWLFKECEYIQKTYIKAWNDIAIKLEAL